MRLRLQRFSFRFAEQVLNSKLALKEEIEAVVTDLRTDISTLSRPHFNEVLKGLFIDKGWQSQPSVFDEADDPSAKMDFSKERIGIEVGFSHASFLGIDLLKFQVASYSGLDKIDVGVYVCTTRSFEKRMKKEYDQNWLGALSFEKIVRYLSHFKSAIQVPILNVTENYLITFLSWLMGKQFHYSKELS